MLGNYFDDIELMEGGNNSKKCNRVRVIDAFLSHFATNFWGISPGIVDVNTIKNLFQFCRAIGIVRLKQPENLGPGLLS